MFISGLLNRKSQRVLWIFLVATTFCFWGCVQSPTKNDSPNSGATDITPQVTGQIVAGSFAEQDSLIQTLTTAGSVFDCMMAFDDKLNLPATTLGKSALQKVRSDALSIDIDYTDTASGIVRVIIYIPGILVKSYDTLSVRYDANSTDAILNNENVISLSGAKLYTSGKIERYMASDLDDDGVVAGDTQYNGKARLSIQSIQGATVEKFVMDFSAGPDGKFDDNADNAIIALSWEKTKNNVCFGRATFSDADNDGVLIDKSKQTQSAVDVTLFEKKPLLRPFVDSVSLTVRVLTDGKNKANDKIIRLSGAEYRIFGRILTVSVTDMHGNSDIMPYDTAIATFVGIPAFQNGFCDTVRLVFDVQTGLQNVNDNLLYELHIKRAHATGLVKSCAFDFVTTQSIPKGQNPQSGHVDLFVVFGDDKTASLTADFDSNGFQGTWTGPNGNTLTVRWDVNGNVAAN